MFLWRAKQSCFFLQCILTFRFDNIQKPEIIAFYNMTKGGDDVLNQKCASYSTSHRRRPWPYFLQCLIWHLWIYTICLLLKTKVKLPHLAFIKQTTYSTACSVCLEMLCIQWHTTTILELLIHQILGSDCSAEPQPTFYTPGPSRERSKYKRCYICPGKIERKTSQPCSKCKNLFAWSALYDVCKNKSKC